jgi:hypothetical protein
MYTRTDMSVEDLNVEASSLRMNPESTPDKPGASSQNEQPIVPLVEVTPSGGDVSTYWSFGSNKRAEWAIYQGELPKQSSFSNQDPNIEDDTDQDILINLAKKPKRLKRNTRNVRRNKTSPSPGSERDSDGNSSREPAQKKRKLGTNAATHKQTDAMQNVKKGKPVLTDPEDGSDEDPKSRQMAERDKKRKEKNSEIQNMYGCLFKR